MTPSEALKKIQNICKNNGWDNSDTFKLETKINEHLDSLSVVELCIGIENVGSSKFEIPDDEMENWKTFGDAAQTLCNHENKK